MLSIKTRIFKLPVIMGCLALMLAAGSANATLLTVNQVIFQSDATLVNNSLLSATVNATVTGTNQLTLLLTNTTPSTAFSGSGAPSTQLLSDIGFTLAGNSIVGGSAAVNTGSTALNFDAGQSTTDISNRWGFANQTIDGFGLPGVLPTNTVITTVANGQASFFTGGSFTGNFADGPGYGAISTSLVNAGFFGASQPGVEDTIKLVLNLSGPASLSQISNVVVSFGSPNAVPDGASTLALLGAALVGVGFVGRKMSKNPLTLA